MQGPSTDNPLAWVAQVVVIASLGAVLPFIFRLRHSRSRLVYCHAVLVACFVVPALQPWQRVLVLARSAGASTASTEVQQQFSWGSLLFWTLAAGVVVRLGWFVMGMWQVRRLRKESLLLRSVPCSIRSARKLTGVDAVFCLSRRVGSPATLGHVNPAVLLPESFLSLDQEAQRSIAIHELLHVRRNDWLVTLLEELTGSLLWFNPGVWWLIAQARLSREELVDEEVVRITRSTAPYIQALLAIAGVSQSIRTRMALAAPLLTKRHLPRRMAALLKPEGGSALRLSVSYGLMALILTAGVLSSFVWFPLVGQTDVVVMASTAPGLPTPPAVPSPNRRRRAPATLKNFTIKVLPPSFAPGVPHEVRGDVFYFLKSGPLPPLELAESAMGVRAIMAFRSIKPGSVVDPAEIERLKQALPMGQRVEVTQDSGNVVTRIVIALDSSIRRFPDEVHRFVIDLPPGAAIPEPAVATSPADGVD